MRARARIRYMSIILDILDEESFTLRYREGDFNEAMKITDSWDIRADVVAAIVAMREWSQEKEEA